MIVTTQFVPNSNTKVSNSKPFVKSNLLRYKSHKTISIPKQFIRNNVTKHSDCFV